VRGGGILHCSAVVPEPIQLTPLVPRIVLEEAGAVGIELLNKTSKSRVVMVLRRFPKRIWSQMELSRVSKRRA
jgi:hypothetical protein